MVMLRMLKEGEMMIDLSEIMDDKLKIEDNRLRQKDEVVAWTEKLEERITILKSQFQIADSDAYDKCSNKRYASDRCYSISLLISNEKGHFLLGSFCLLSFVALIVLIALYSGEWWKLLLGWFGLLIFFLASFNSYFEPSSGDPRWRKLLGAERPHYLNTRNARH